MAGLASAFAASAPAGSSSYQKQVVTNAAQNARPQYLRALNDARQGAANRGVLSSGAGAAETGRVGQDWRQSMSGISGQAAVDASNLQEQERIRQQAREWQLADVDSNHRWQEKLLADQQHRADEQAGNQRWFDLLGGVGGALGGAFGLPLGALAGKGLYGWLNGGAGEPDWSKLDTDPGLPEGA